MLVSQGLPILKTLIAHEVFFVNRQHNNSGFTLVEILIAMIILSIGFLGLASLQTTGMQNSDGAYMQTQASVLAYDMAERIKANADNVSYGSVALGASTAQDCTSGACTPAQIKSHDVNTWKTSLARTLPAGDGSISQTSGSGTTTSTDDTYLIQVVWNNRAVSRNFSLNVTP